jgi:hypothetical protein
MTLSMSPAEALGRAPAEFLHGSIVPQFDMDGRICACGDYVWANPAKPTAGVMAHNATLAHLAWWERARDQWQGEETS